ncbi:MAG: histidine phosphatase family protein [Actinomycetota bacterium]|nr:histidine phosphatase family protein [Actinomycetota bacterium]
MRVHWVRHGEVASHRGDVPLTDEGVAQARKRGRSLAKDVSRGEVVHFMHAPTLRTRQTAEEIRGGMSEVIDPGGGAELPDVTERWAIRNPDLFVAGQRVEMVSSVEALAEQLSAPVLDPEKLSEHTFFREFWASPDRIGYWLEHPDPPGEDTVAVARRQVTFALSLLDGRKDRPVRYVLATHSPVLRAILLCYAGEDPGEPEYLEPVDLILSQNGASELRFRGLRTSLSGSSVVKDVPR